MASIVAVYLFLSQHTKSIRTDLSLSTITCNDPLGCDWKCKSNGDCDGSTFRCPSTVDHCFLSCKSCDGVSVFSSAALFEIYCTDRHGCPHMNITAEHSTTRIPMSRP